MKIELTNEQATVLRPLVEWCAETQSRNIVIGQIIPGDWRELEKTWLVCATIPASTAHKIRKLIERDRALLKSPIVTAAPPP